MSDRKTPVASRLNYEIFILVITCISILNLFLVFVYRDPDIVEVLNLINRIISLILLIDFLARLRIAESRREYFFKKYGWLDLVGGIPVPGTQLARVPRIIRTGQLLRQSGETGVIKAVIDNRADTALLFISLFVILLLEFGSISILRAEQRSAMANIDSAGDAIWWVLVTISTVGYGDYYPVTPQGRFVAIFVIVAGVGVFGTLSGFLAKSFLGQSQKEARQQAEAVQSVVNAIQEMQQAQVETRHLQDDANEELRSRLTAIETMLKQISEDKEGA